VFIRAVKTGEQGFIFEQKPMLHPSIFGANPSSVSPLCLLPDHAKRQYDYKRCQRPQSDRCAQKAVVETKYSKNHLTSIASLRRANL
jgi:hypothetical protein